MADGVIQAEIESSGFCLVPAAIPHAWTEKLRLAVGALSTHHRGGARNLLQDSPVISAFAACGPVVELIEQVLGEGVFAVRALLFDKTPEANWRVAWHQDTAIAVASRVDVPGFVGWSEKEGVPHVHPPAEVLEAMVAVRIHLDDCLADNGPLRVLPGSHRHGKLADDDIARRQQVMREIACCCVAGDALLIKPLLLHASSRAIAPGHRRVVHIEYACRPLPGGLKWHAIQD